MDILYMQMQMFINEILKVTGQYFPCTIPHELELECCTVLLTV